MITLTTDFGTSDWFVGTLKCVIAGLAPGVPVIDITHDVPPGDVWAGAFALTATAPYCPPNAVHVAVVDPGVGSHRAAIALQTDHGTFIGPDNGLLSLVVRNRQVRAAHVLSNRDWFLPRVSQTFHGRDVFAPVAARLALGHPIADAGPQLARWEKLTWPEPRPSPHAIDGEVVHVDRYGNAITNIPVELLARHPHLNIVDLMGRAIPTLDCYAAVAVGEPVAVPGSTGYLEVVINQGNAARTFGLSRGSSIHLTSGSQ